MVRILNSLVGAAALATLAHAAPAPLFGIHIGSGTKDNGQPTAVSQGDITTDLQRPAQFARAAYCPTDAVKNWSCGSSCTALPNVKVLASGGDNGATPNCEYTLSRFLQARAHTVSRFGLSITRAHSAFGFERRARACACVLYLCSRTPISDTR